MIDTVDFFVDFWLCLLLYFILWSNFFHFVWFWCLPWIQKINFCISLFCKFYVFENETKVCLKIYKKNYFFNLESLCDDMLNDWSCWIFHGYLDVSTHIFYFTNQLRSFCIIPMFIINNKINFCIPHFCKFYVFWKWNKSLFKNL